MKTLNYKLTLFSVSKQLITNLAMSMLLLLFWITLPNLLEIWQPTAGLLDGGIWQLILLSLIAFLGIINLSWWLLNRYWRSLNLPELHHLVSQFKNLASWQQLGFYWASFALLLLAAVACLAAIV